MELRGEQDRAAVAPPGAWPAWAALVVGLAYPGISIYWGLGGTWLLDTVAGPLAAGGRARGKHEGHGGGMGRRGAR